MIGISLVLASSAATTKVSAVSNAGSSAAATLSIDPLSYLSPAAANAVQAKQRMVTDLRNALASGYVSKLRAIFIANGQEPPATPVLNVPDVDDIAATANLPTLLRDPVAGMRAAARQMLDLLGGPVAATTEMRSEIEHTFTDLIASARVTAMSSPSGASSTLLLPPTGSGAPSFSPSEMAALVLAAALDRYLPDLQTAASQLQSQVGSSAAGCDLLDETPLLCVGSAANNSYTQNEIMLIDLGGDDTYNNNAGGAPFLSQDGTLYYPLSVNIDLGGNNTYNAPFTLSADGSSAFTIAQGAAIAGGVGIAVDLGSTSNFNVVPPVTSNAYHQIIAQGATSAGVGLLFHNGGPANYSVFAGTAASQFVLAQGAQYGGCGSHIGINPIGGGAGCGPAALINQGGADDVYQITLGPLGKGELGLVQAQGAGDGENVAVFSDDGGTDTVKAAVTTQAAPPYSLDVNQRSLNPPVIGLYAQASNGILLEGQGDTSYTLALDEVGEVSSQIIGQAAGSGPTALDDLGGNDTFSAQSIVTDNRRIVIDDTCGCNQAEASVTAEQPNTIYVVQGGAWGTQGGALLQDHGGNTTYSAVAENNLQVDLEDRLTNPTAPPKLDILGYSNAPMTGQGFALGTVVGLLEDLGGTNSYLLRGTSSTYASAFSLRATGTPLVTAIAPGKAPLMGQGASLGATSTTQNPQNGALLDLGTNSTFEASSPDTVTTAPDPNGAFAAGVVWPKVQGYGAGSVFLAGGATPQTISIPNQADCGLPGYRGFGTWLPCAPGDQDPDHTAYDDGYQTGETVPDEAAAGYAPNANGSLPALSFTSDTPSQVSITYDQPASVSPRINVGATLLDPAGNPIVGAIVHFDVQGLLINNLTTALAYRNLWEADGVTGSDGIARASLPLAFGGTPYNFDQPGVIQPAAYRLLTTYDGIGNLYYPRHVALPLTTTVCAGDTCPPPPRNLIPSSVVSRKIHSSAGMFDIDLTSGNGIECRSGGASGDYMVVFIFADPLTNVGGASVTSGVGSVAAGYVDSHDPHNYIVNLTGVTNAQVITVGLTNVTDSAGNFSSAISARMGVLVGDVNASSRVDAADVSSVRQQTLQPVTASNFREDVNTSGRIDAADVSVVRQQTLTSLP
jgi:hypothetical protein